MDKSKFSNTIVSKQYVRIFSLVVIGISLIVLFGWYSSLMFLTRFSINEVPMAPSTAYGFIGLAVGLWFYLCPQKIAINRNAAIVSAVIVICLSCLFVVTNMFNYYGNWEHVFVKMPTTQLSMQLGHMSVVTALLFIISGFAFLFLLSNRKLIKTLSIILTLIIFIISFILLLAYGFVAPFFYFDNFIPPAVLTVLSFFLVSLALIAASDKNIFFNKTIWEISTSAKLLRIFLPTTIAIVVIESLIVIRILPLLNIHPAFGVSLVTLIVVVVVIVIILILSKSMGKSLDIASNNLSESEEKYRSLVEGSLQGVVVGLNDPVRIAYASSPMERITGYSHEELESFGPKELTELIHKDDRDSFFKGFTDRIAGKYVKQNKNYRLNHKDGRVRWIELYSTLIEYKNEPATQTVFVDITERKKADAALLISEEKYRDLVNLAQEGIWVIDKNNTTSFVNPSMAMMLGYTSEEMLRKSLFYFMDEVGIKIANKNLERRKAGIRDQHDFEFICKNGDRIITAIDTSPILDKAGNYDGAIAGVMNITERKLAEEKLVESEEKYRTMIETSNDLIWILDHKGDFTFINAHAEKATGYLLNDLKGKSFHPLVIENELPALNEVFTKTMSGENISYEMSLKTIYGNTLTLAVNTAPLSADGKVQGLYSFARDITHKKEAERLLKESEKRFKALHNASFGGIAIHDVGIIKDCNQGLSDITGYTLEELIGMDGLLCIAKDSRNIVMQNILAYHENAYEVIGLRKNGEEYPLRLEAKMIPYQGKNMRVIEFRDITEQKKAENDVRRLSTAVQQSPSIVAISNTEGILDYVNPKFTEITGYSSDEAIGQESNILNSGEHDLEFYEELWATLESGKVWRGQFHNKKKNGELFWEAASISAILNESGDIINYIKIGEDITQQKKIDADLEIALEKAMESDRLKSAFLANMSHEIRTPMNGILGFAGLLKTPGLTGDEQQEYINIIEKGGARMLNIINDIVSISMIESGQMKVSIKESNINEQIEYIYNFFKLEVEEKGMQLSLNNSLPLSAAIINTDREKVFAILTNIVKNAIKYTDKGSIELGYSKKGNFLEFYVKDTGIGVPKDRQKAIFERFIQSDIEDVMARQGAGLGLSITKAYVEILGGRIWVESEFGKGSTFYFTIPYTEKANVEQDDNINKTDVDADDIIKNLKVLLVEDDQVSMDFLEIIMVESKTIITANNGAEAVKMCKENTDIDLILMDINMPIMDGIEATKEIRHFNKDVIIIAQTAYGLSGDREKAIEAGCNDYVSKPIVKKVLLSKISK